jgi:hypothetical protein
MVTTAQPARKRSGKAAYLVAPILALLIAGFEFKADQWIIECDVQTTSGDCSIIGVFRGMSRRGMKGSFSLAVDFQSGMVAVVGTPSPVKATIRIDNQNPVQCVGEHYCFVSSTDSKSLVRDLVSGKIVLLDVSTAKDAFLLSLTAQGFQAGLNKILAHRDLPAFALGRLRCPDRLGRPCSP